MYPNVRGSGVVRRYVRAIRALRSDRSMLFVMPCAHCGYELSADELTLIPQLSQRFKEHLAVAHARDAEPGHQAASGR